MEPSVSIFGEDIIKEVIERNDELGKAPAPLNLGIAPGRSFPQTNHALDLGRRRKQSKPVAVRSQMTSQASNLQEDYQKRNAALVESMTDEERQAAMQQIRSLISADNLEAFARSIGAAPLPPSVYGERPPVVQTSASSSSSSSSAAHRQQQTSTSTTPGAPVPLDPHDPSSREHILAVSEDELEILKRGSHKDVQGALAWTMEVDGDDDDDDDTARQRTATNGMERFDLQGRKVISTSEASTALVARARREKLLPSESTSASGHDGIAVHEEEQILTAAAVSVIHAAAAAGLVLVVDVKDDQEENDDDDDDNDDDNDDDGDNTSRASSRANLGDDQTVGRELYQHERDGHRAGYSIHEAMELARSVVASQRVIGWQILAGLLSTSESLSSAEADSWASSSSSSPSSSRSVSSIGAGGTMGTHDMRVRAFLRAPAVDAWAKRLGLPHGGAAAAVLSPLAAMSLPAEMPSLLLMRAPRETESSARLHLQCVASFLISPSEEEAAAEIWKGFGGWMAPPPFMAPHSRRAAEPYAVHATTNTARLLAMGPPEETYDLKTDVLHQLALRARWSRVDTMLAPASGLLSRMTEVLLDAMCVVVVAPRGGKWRTQRRPPRDVLAEAAAVEAALPVARVLVAAVRCCVTDHVLETLKALVRGPLWTALAAGGPVGPGTASASHLDVRGSGSGGDGSVTHQRRSARQLSSLCWHLVAETVRRDRDVAEALCEDAGLMENVFALILHPAHVGDDDEPTADNTVVGINPKGVGKTSDEGNDDVEDDRDDEYERHDNIHDTAAVWAVRTWRVCVIYGLPRALSALSELHGLLLTSSSGANAQARAWPHPEINDATPVEETAESGTSASLSLSVFSKNASTISPAARLELLWVVEHAAVSVASTLETCGRIRQEVVEKRSHNEQAMLLEAHVDAVENMSKHDESQLRQQQDALEEQITQGARVARTVLHWALNALEVLPRFSSMKEKDEGIVALHLIATVLGSVGHQSPSTEAAAVALRGRGLLCSIAALKSVSVMSGAVAYEEDATVGLLFQQARRFTEAAMADTLWTSLSTHLQSAISRTNVTTTAIAMETGPSTSTARPCTAEDAGDVEEVDARRAWCTAESLVALVRAVSTVSSYHLDKAAAASLAMRGAIQAAHYLRAQAPDVRGHVRGGLLWWQVDRLAQVSQLLAAASCDDARLAAGHPGIGEESTETEAHVRAVLRAVLTIGPAFAGVLARLVNRAAQLLIAHVRRRELGAHASTRLSEEDETLAIHAAAAAVPEAAAPELGRGLGAGRVGSLAVDWANAPALDDKSGALCLPLSTSWAYAALKHLPTTLFGRWLHVVCQAAPLMAPDQASAVHGASEASSEWAGAAFYHLLSAAVDTEDGLRWEAADFAMSKAEEEARKGGRVENGMPSSIASDYIAALEWLQWRQHHDPVGFVRGFLELTRRHHNTGLSRAPAKDAQALVQRHEDSALDLYRATLNAASSQLIDEDVHAAQLALLVHADMPWRARLLVWDELGSLGLLQLLNSALLTPLVAGAAGEGGGAPPCPASSMSSARLGSPSPSPSWCEKSRPVVGQMLMALRRLRRVEDRGWPAVRLAVLSVASFLRPSPLTSSSSEHERAHGMATETLVLPHSRAVILTDLLQPCPSARDDHCPPGGSDVRGDDGEEWLCRDVLARLVPGAAEGWREVRVARREGTLGDMVRQLRPALLS